MLTFKDIQERCIIFKINLADRLITAQANIDFKRKTGLSIKQFHTLSALEIYGKNSLTNSSNQLGMDRTTLQRNIQNLIKKEMITYTPSPDKRIKSYRLTVRGSAMLEKGYVEWSRIDHKKYVDIIKNSLDKQVCI